MGTELDNCLPFGGHFTLKEKKYLSKKSKSPFLCSRISRSQNDTFAFWMNLLCLNLNGHDDSSFVILLSI